MTFIVCVYEKECKLCQIVNEYLEYLDKKGIIKYKRVHAIKALNNMIKNGTSLKELSNISITTPAIYLIQGNDMVLLNVEPFIDYFLKYKHSIINKEESSNYILKTIMGYKNT